MMHKTFFPISKDTFSCTHKYYFSYAIKCYFSYIIFANNLKKKIYERISLKTRREEKIV